MSRKLTNHRAGVVERILTAIVLVPSVLAMCIVVPILSFFDNRGKRKRIRDKNIPDRNNHFCLLCGEITVSKVLKEQWTYIYKGKKIPFAFSVLECVRCGITTLPDDNAEEARFDINHAISRHHFWLKDPFGKYYVTKEDFQKMMLKTCGMKKFTVK